MRSKPLLRAGSARRSEVTSAPIPKFASLRGTLSCELRNQRSTSKYMFLVRFMILVPLFDLKFLNEPAATAVGTQRGKDQAMQRYKFVPPGGGPNYDWSRDHTFVKVAGADTGGAFA